MASVPSAGCLLARNQFYRSPRQRDVSADQGFNERPLQKSQTLGPRQRDVSADQGFNERPLQKSQTLARYNSTSSTSSAGSSHDHITDHEKTPVVHGIHIPFEKCWLLKRFFHSENQPIVTEISSGSTPS